MPYSHHNWHIGGGGDGSGWLLCTRVMDCAYITQHFVIFQLNLKANYRQLCFAENSLKCLSVWLTSKGCIIALMYLFIFPMHQAADEDYTSCLLFNFFP